MNRIAVATFAWLTVVAPSGIAQNAAQVLYAESFRQGPTHVTEASFEVKLDPQNRSFRERIKDARGADRYVFTVTPQGPEGDTKITSWVAKLEDLHHTIYSNILLPTQDPDSGDPKNNLWRLEPGRFAAVPIHSVRVIKVDSFYVLLHVESHHFTPIDSPYLDSMTVEVKFSNNDPRAEQWEVPASEPNKKGASSNS